MKELRIRPVQIIADVAAGTGILTEALLKLGNTVLAVEPNKEMREAAEQMLAGYPGFRSIAGSAEGTGLEHGSVDLITVGHAFHWFDVDRTRLEFARILRSEGWIVLLFNWPRADSTPFQRAYEALLRTFSVDYDQVVQKHPDDATLRRFFGPGGYKTRKFDNYQVFNYESLEGRLLSSSFVPPEGHPRFDPMVEHLRQIFADHQVGGTVRFEYDTVVHYGRLT